MNVKRQKDKSGETGGPGKFGDQAQSVLQSVIVNVSMLAACCEPTRCTDDVLVKCEHSNSLCTH